MHNPINALMGASYTLDLVPTSFVPTARLPPGFSCHPFAVYSAEGVLLLSVEPVGDPEHGPVGGEGSGEHWMATVMTGPHTGRALRLRPSDDAAAWAFDSLRAAIVPPAQDDARDELHEIVFQAERVRFDPRAQVALDVAKDAAGIVGATAEQIAVAERIAAG